MPKCKFCKEEINYLQAYSEVCQTYELDNNGNPRFSGCDHLEGFNSFSCPFCNELIAKTEQEAIKFLKGEK